MQAASHFRPTITVIIPTLNEARNLPRVFPRLPQDLHEIVVVDGKSVDDTLEVARRLRPDVRLIVQDGYGKGDALACGFAAATGDIIVILDADGSADPAEIPRLVGVLLAGADFAKSARPGGRGAGRGRPGWRDVADRGLGAMINALCHTRYSDPSYGFSAFWRRHVPLLSLDGPASAKAHGRVGLGGTGLEVDTLISVRAARAGLTVREIASRHNPGNRTAGNVQALANGARVLYAILAEQYRARRQGGAVTTARGRGYPT